MDGHFWVHKPPKIGHTHVFSQGKSSGFDHSLKWINEKTKRLRITGFDYLLHFSE